MMPYVVWRQVWSVVRCVMVQCNMSHQRDKPRTWVLILASVRFFICSVALFLLCYPCEALEGQILTRVCII